MGVYSSKFISHMALLSVVVVHCIGFVGKGGTFDPPMHQVTSAYILYHTVR